MKIALLLVILIKFSGGQNILDEFQHIISFCRCGQTFDSNELPGPSTRSYLSDMLKTTLQNLHDSGVLELAEIGTDGSSLHLWNTTISGFDTMTFTSQGNGILINLDTFHMAIDNLIATGFYKMDNFDLGIISLEGDGDFNVKITEFVFDLSFQGAILSNNVSVRIVEKFGIEMGSASVRFNNLYDDGRVSELVHEIINTILPFLIKALHSDVSTHLQGTTCLNEVDIQCTMRYLIRYVICLVMKDVKLPLGIQIIC